MSLLSYALLIAMILFSSADLLYVLALVGFLFSRYAVAR
jgi:hypothetical protein